MTMTRFLILCLFVASVACEDSDDSYSESVKLAAVKCGQSPSKMDWLRDLIKSSEQDVSFSGNIYAVTVDGDVIFIHQPAVMSCMACVMYDCDGNRIDRSAVDPQKVADAMRPSAVIYSPY